MAGAAVKNSLRYLLGSRRSLRAKFITVIVIVQLTVMGLVTIVVERRQRDTILHESRQRALALAEHLAALSEGYMLSYNFVKLEQIVEKTATAEDVAYAIVHTHNGEVAVYSGYPEKQGLVLNDPISHPALAAETPLIQEVSTAALHGRGYDLAFPIFAPGGTRKWGTVRLGFSLARATREIHKTSQQLYLLGLVALVLSEVVATCLALRISRPIQQLVTGVDEVARGNYDHALTVTSRDEVGQLAGHFEAMRTALRLHVTHLAQEKQRLEQANKTIKETQQQLIQSEKLAAVGKLSAKVAHEVNNPLAIIKTSLHLINKQMSDDDPNKENLAIIEEEIARIARIVRHLLDSARPSRDVSPVQINEVIRKLMKIAAEDFASQGITCHLDLQEDLPVVRISLDQLKQVLLNLIKNAREAMPQGGRLCLQTTEQGDWVVIRVIDTGIGIAQEHLPTLFEPFFSTKPEGEGTGLGLAVSQSIIKSFGGVIEVDSQAGQGTTFRVLLPEYPLSIVGHPQDSQNFQV